MSDNKMVDEFYVCDICGEPMLVPDSKISLKRYRYIFHKEEPSSHTVKSYDLCKNCYESVNGFVRDLKIKAKRNKKP